MKRGRLDVPPRTSADVTSLIGANRKGTRLQLTVSGYVSRERAAPSHFDDVVYIVVPSHNPEGSTALKFPAIHGNSLPQQGAAALVAYDENSTPYLIWWDGTHS